MKCCFLLVYLVVLLVLFVMVLFVFLYLFDLVELECCVWGCLGFFVLDIGSGCMLVYCVDE